MGILQYLESTSYDSFFRTVDFWSDFQGLIGLPFGTYTVSQVYQKVGS